MKCAKCTKDGMYKVAFVGYPLGHAHVKRNERTGAFNVQLCDSHKNAIEVKDLISSRGWEQIQSKLLTLGLPLLDRSTIRLVVY